MSTDYTLAEIRRHWALYVTFPDLPETRHRAIANSFARRGKVLPFQRFSQAWRSAGPLMCGIDFKEGVTECVRDWWKNGLLAVEGDKSLLAATILNPTFVYSMAGEGCALNYTISPLTCFHLAPIVAQEPLTQLHLIDGMKAQFAGWCSALRGALSSSSPPILRFFVGDATVVCHSIRIFANSRSMKPGMPVSQWKTEPVQFNQWEYVDSPNPAPTSFNVIHTSNLEDSIGLLNVLISTVPLLSQEPSSVLYTESLETKGQDGVKEFEFEDGRLHGNITIMALVLGVCPVDYLCGFGTRTNTHELLLDHGGSHLAKKNMEKNKDEYHDPYYVQQIIKWKAPTSGDPIASQIRVPIPSFEPKQMGEFLFDLHQSLFPVKAAVSRWDPNADTLVEALGNSKVETHYTREAFALIVSLVRSRFQPSMDDWRQTLSVLRNRVIMASTKSNILAVHLVDWAHQMERYGLIGTEKSDMNRKQGPFRAWKKVPDQVRVILVVPKPVIDRAKLKTICEDPKLGYPPFHCDITSTATERSMFWSCLHASFGRVIRTGTEDNPQVIFEEDVKGWNGDSPLVVSFTTPYNVFTEDWGPYETISVNFGILNTPRMSKFFPGTVDRKASSMRHFSAQATDSSFVHIVPEPPLPRRRQMQEDSTVVASEPSTILVQQIGTADAAHFQLDEDCEQVASLGVRIEVTDERSKRLFSVERGKVTVEQLSACVLRVTLGGRVQDIAFPFPVVGSQHHLRLARTSGYIEVVVPPFNSQRADGMKLNPYPIIRHGSAMIPWSFHRLSLPSLPIVDRSSRVLQHLCSWLNPHICTMFSTRERAARKHGQHDMIMFVKDTILSVFTDATGMQQNRTPRQAFRFLDESMKHGSDTYIFLNEIRFDLESHTVVCDCYVMTLTLPLLALIQKEFTKFVASGEVALIPLQTGETQAWKQIMPSLVERGENSGDDGNVDGSALQMWEGERRRQDADSGFVEAVCAVRDEDGIIADVRRAVF
ncbi:hypothetical protein MD484_g1063, partial [Candolleomyces efflorescens]